MLNFLAMLFNILGLSVTSFLSKWNTEISEPSIVIHEMHKVSSSDIQLLQLTLKKIKIINCKTIWLFNLWVEIIKILNKFFVPLKNMRKHSSKSAEKQIKISVKWVVARHEFDVLQAHKNYEFYLWGVFYQHILFEQ